MVFRATVSWQHGLSLEHGVAVRGPAGSKGAGREPVRSDRPPRGAAHHVYCPGRSSGTADCTGLHIDVPLLDVSKPGNSCLERAREAVRAVLAEPFDLVRGPLLRASLVRLEHDYHWLVLHHIVADGWSFEVLHRDLRALYEARRRHEQAALPALPVQYGDFACWQRRILQGERLMPCLPIGRRN